MLNFNAVSVILVFFSSVYGTLPNPIRSAHFAYKNQPGKIADFTPGHSSANDKERREVSFWHFSAAVFFCRTWKTQSIDRADWPALHHLCYCHGGTFISCGIYIFTLCWRDFVFSSMKLWKHATLKTCAFLHIIVLLPQSTLHKILFRNHQNRSKFPPKNSFFTDGVLIIGKRNLK